MNVFLTKKRNIQKEGAMKMIDHSSHKHKSNYLCCFCGYSYCFYCCYHYCYWCRCDYHYFSTTTLTAAAITVGAAVYYYYYLLIFYYDYYYYYRSCYSAPAECLLSSRPCTPGCFVLHVILTATL